MTVERKQVYNEWSLKTKSRDECVSKALEYTRLGDEIFKTKYNSTFPDDDVDLEMDDYWNKADEQSIEKINLDTEISICLKKLIDLTPDNFLDDYESCANITYGFKKKVRVKFFDGEEAIGYIYPWEGDYSGPPYYFTDGNRHDTKYINIGEFIESVELI